MENLKWRWGHTNFQRNFVWRKKKLGQNSVVQIDRRNFCMSREYGGGATLRWHNPWPKFRRKLGHGAKTGQNRAATKIGTSRLYEPRVCRLCHLNFALHVIKISAKSMLCAEYLSVSCRDKNLNLAFRAPPVCTLLRVIACYVPIHPLGLLYSSWTVATFLPN